MKGYATAAAPPAKRRWRARGVAVLALVFVSLLVPLAFLLGLHNTFPAGYFTDDRSPPEFSFGNDRHMDRIHESFEDHPSRVENVMRKIETTLAKDDSLNITAKNDRDLHKKSETDPTGNGEQFISQTKSTTDFQRKEITDRAESKDTTLHSETKHNVSNSKGPALPAQQVASSKPLLINATSDGRDRQWNSAKGSFVDETRKSCQLEFGSYCLWSVEHKEAMQDSVVKRLKDQLFVARAYYPSIAKLRAQEKLSHEVKQSIQEHERMLSEAISDADLPSYVQKHIVKMDQTIAKAKSCPVECNNVDKKLRQLLDLTEDEAHFHMKQSAFLYHLGAQTMPKSLHCLSLRLTVEYFRSPSVDTKHYHAHMLDNPSLRHIVVFSKNILAASVTINSTVMNSEETGNMVFHLLTDVENYYAMKHFFSRNSFKDASIHVLNFEALDLHHPNQIGLTQLTMSEEFRISIRNIDQPSASQMRTEYISVFGHSHFLLPEIFKNLKKVVVLDDDVIVQRDLSYLWNLDLEGKVIGAVEFCGVTMGQLKFALGKNNYDSSSCAWMSGLNIVDLEKWREQHITRIYKELLQKFQSRSEASWRAAALPISLLAFENLVYPLDNTWIISGLGHDYTVNIASIKNSAALHFNGNMKPWLELGIPQYKRDWKKFLTRQERFMEDCNVNP